MFSRDSLAKSIKGIGTARLDFVARRLPNGPRRLARTVARFFLLCAGKGWSQVDSSATSNKSCRYATGPSGDKCAGGTQFTIEPSAHLSPLGPVAYLHDLLLVAEE